MHSYADTEEVGHDHMCSEEFINEVWYAKVAAQTKSLRKGSDTNSKLFYCISTRKVAV